MGKAAFPDEVSATLRPVRTIGRRTRRGLIGKSVAVAHSSRKSDREIFALSSCLIKKSRYNIQLDVVVLLQMNGK